MKLISYVTGAGAKGKFSGGFDISSFKGKQMDTGMLCFFPVLYSDSALLVLEMKFRLCT